MKSFFFAAITISMILIAGCSPASPTASTFLKSTPAVEQMGHQQTIPPPKQSSTPGRLAGDAATAAAENSQVETASTKTSLATPTQSSFKTTRTPTIASLTPIPKVQASVDLGTDGWKELPVIPVIDDEVLRIYATGLELGNNPLAFSKIGDCGSTPAWFLGDFDRGPRYYRLGDYEYLGEVIDYFKGSYDRTSLAARSGFNASALFVPLWADRTFCESDESPLECEYRVHKPAIAFIMLGANDVWHPEEFEPQMRKIIEYSIEKGVIPILATKADDQEKNGSINATIARLALEYKVPLWNFWKAAQALPDKGLQEDGVHLTWGANHFDEPFALENAWPMRNLTALQMLKALMEKISRQE